MIPETDLVKSLEQLENDFWIPPKQFPSQSIQDCFLNRKIPICMLNLQQIHNLVFEHVGLDYVMYLAVEKLNANLLLGAVSHPGDLLEAVLDVPNQFWMHHIPLKIVLTNVINKQIASIFNTTEGAFRERIYQKISFFTGD